jgi:uncharacterized protein (DUF305 family)
MRPAHYPAAGILVLATIASAGCASHSAGPAQTAPAPASGAASASASAPAATAATANTGPVRTSAAAIAEAHADSVRHPYTTADVQFMQGMIGHHAQALIMAAWAPTHDASPSVQTLCLRIINSQQDEITLMQHWLADRQQMVPDGHTPGMKMMMNGTEQTMLMPGMLTPAQMTELDHAKGLDFDRFFLTDMIQHHRGAVSMVHDLFETQGAGQDEIVFKFASDANVDQTTEIARMEKMLAIVRLESGTQ